MNTGACLLRNLEIQFKLGDLGIFLFFNRRLECRVLDVMMKILTALGSLPFAVTLTVSLLVFDSLLLSGLGIRLAVALIIGQLAVQMVKRLVNRPRPYTVSEQAHPKNPPSCAYSFPSGHTCAAFCIALTLAHSLPALAVPAIITAVLVGLSRVYLGVHYPSDVICGAFTAYISYWLQTLM